MLSSSARLLSKTSMSTQMQSVANVSNLTIIGAGMMGAGIAQLSAAKGINVVVVDQNDKILGKAKAGMQKTLGRVAKKQFKGDDKKAEDFVKSTMSRIMTSTDAAAAVSQADLCIEAIVENLDVKRKLFKTLEAAAQPSCVFATNTSSLSLTDIATAVKRKDKFGGLHFFNPVAVMKLLEVVRTNDTSDETDKILTDFGKKLDKVTVHCRDTPGFIVNRLLVPYLMDAVRMVESGNVTAPDVDTAMKLGAGYPMGPFQLLDYIGLDTCKAIIDGWHEKEPNVQAFAPVKTLTKLVKDKKLGLKTGEGFYKY